MIVKYNEEIWWAGRGGGSFLNANSLSVVKGRSFRFLQAMFNTDPYLQSRLQARIRFALREDLGSRNWRFASEILVLSIGIMI